MSECICPTECDCQRPEPKNGGAALVSNYCPIHNERPAVDEDCEFEGEVHKNGGIPWQ